jgi:hypothetical protein
MQPLTSVEMKLCQWQHAKLLGLEDHPTIKLFSLMASDPTSLGYFQEHFPDEVEAFQRFRSDPAYRKSLDETFHRILPIVEG